MKKKKIVYCMYYILMFLPLVVTVISLIFLPDRIPAHYGSENQVTRWGSKYETLIFPAETMICGAIITAVAKSAAGNKKDGEKNEKAVVIIGIAVLLLFNLMIFYFLTACALTSVVYLLLAVFLKIPTAAQAAALYRTQRLFKPKHFAAIARE